MGATDTVKLESADVLRKRREEEEEEASRKEAEARRVEQERAAQEQRRAAEKREAEKCAAQQQRLAEAEAAEARRRQQEEEAERRRKEEAAKAEEARKRQEEADRKKLEEWLAANKFHDPNAKKSKWFKSSLPLHQAVTDADEDMVRILIANNADVNAQNSSKQTPLQLAEKLSQKTPGKYGGAMAVLRR